MFYVYCLHKKYEIIRYAKQNDIVGHIRVVNKVYTTQIETEIIERRNLHNLYTLAHDILQRKLGNLSMPYIHILYRMNEYSNSDTVKNINIQSK